MKLGILVCHRVDLHVHLDAQPLLRSSIIVDKNFPVLMREKLSRSGKTSNAILAFWRTIASGASGVLKRSAPLEHDYRAERALERTTSAKIKTGMRKVFFAICSVSSNELFARRWCACK